MSSPGEPERAPVSADVIVVGAGPAGLASAWYAARRGAQVVVIERSGHVGGLARSIEVAGQRVDLGSHRLHPSIRTDLLDDLRGLLGESLQWRLRKGRIRLHGRWLAFPLRPLDLARHAPPRFAARVARDLALARWRRDATGATFRDALRRGFGPAISEDFYEPYARKLFGAEAHELSAELHRRRVSAGSAGGVLRRMVRRGPPAGFWYPQAGFGAISEAIADDAVARGVHLMLGRSVASTDVAGDHVAATLDDGTVVRAATLVGTIPPADLLRTITGVPADVTAAAEALQSRAAVLVYLVVPRPSYTCFDAHYFPDPAMRVARVSEPKRYRDSPADPAAQTVLCAELPASAGDEVWSAGDDELVALVTAELTAAGLPHPSPTGAHVERRAQVYPIYRLGHEHHQRVLDAWFDANPRLATLGRQGLFAHDNTHHALLMGHDLAATLRTDGTVDAEQWRHARARFAAHVVED